MTKNADFGPNLAVFGPKSLIFMGVSKSFGTNITENHLDNLSAFYFFTCTTFSGRGQNMVSLKKWAFLGPARWLDNKRIHGAMWHKNAKDIAGVVQLQYNWGVQCCTSGREAVFEYRQCYGCTKNIIDTEAISHIENIAKVQKTWKEQCNAGVQHSAVAWSKEQCRSGGAGGVVEQCKRSSEQWTTMKRTAVQTLQMD